MMTLPRAARNSVLLNLCNLAPVLHPRSVVMIHDAQTYLFPQDYSGRQAAGYRALLPIIGSRAAKVITVSEYSKARLVEHRIAAADKIDVIHNGSDHILDEPADPSVLAKHALEQGGYVLVIGTTKRYKNISTVFRALEDTGLRLVVAGGPGNAQSYLELGIKPPESTLFTGFVSDAELRSLYSHAGVFCLPSLTEGFGLPAVEAMQCGCPVIASNAGAMPEICGDAAILVSAENSGEWREAIKAVLGEPARADDLRKAGYDRAAAFQWERAAQQLWSSLEPLL
ncbi:MAG: glycosyltransferase family 1 protein [Pseudomonadota bacterium]